MSKAECNRAYLRHKMAAEAAFMVPKVTKVKSIFRRKPYSSTNYATPTKMEEEKDEQGRIE